MRYCMRAAQFGMLSAGSVVGVEIVYIFIE